MRTALPRAALLGLLLSGSLLAAACGHQTRADQALRTCIDRWNQDNMVGQGPAPANIAFRRPIARERASTVLPRRRLCIVAIAAGGGTWTCVLARNRRVLVSAPSRADGAAADAQERNDRQAWRARFRGVAQGHSPDAAAPVATLSARRRLREAVDLRRRAPRGHPIHRNGTRALLPRFRDGHLRDQLSSHHAGALRLVLPGAQAMASR